MTLQKRVIVDERSSYGSCLNEGCIGIAGYIRRCSAILLFLGEDVSFISWSRSVSRMRFEMIKGARVSPIYNVEVQEPTQQSEKSPWAGFEIITAREERTSSYSYGPCSALCKKEEERPDQFDMDQPQNP